MILNSSFISNKDEFDNKIERISSNSNENIEI
jgi:hypothetical protein